MVRDLLSTVSGGEPLPGGGAIAGRFAAFREDLPSICTKLHLRVEELTFANYAYMVPALLTEQATGPPRSSTKPVIAIDGPAAAGKGTLARRIAAVLGLPYLDTGLLYRAVGRLVLDGGGDPADPVTAETAARALRPDDLERGDLRGPVADAAAAAVAAIPGVRAALLDFQRGFATERGAVLDGRDIGTVIFPDAPAKLYVTASLAERARRRWLELKAKGIAADLAIVEAEMLARDTRDAPNMRRAVDADVLDTTSLDAEAAFKSALGTVRRKLGRAKPPKPVILRRSGGQGACRSDGFMPLLATCSRSPQADRNLMAGQRRTEEITLHLRAAVGDQMLKLLLRLHALGQRADPQACAKRGHGANNGAALLTVGQVAHEGLVDLDLVEREAAQIAERRVAGAEVVHRDVHARALELRAASLSVVRHRAAARSR